MKRSILVLVCASATLLVAARTASREYARKSAGSSQSERKSAPAPNLARMEQVVQSFVKDKQFMGAVLVARENEVLLDKGYGFAILSGIFRTLRKRNFGWDRSRNSSLRHPFCSSRNGEN